MSKVLIGTVIPEFALDGDDWRWWLKNQDCYPKFVAYETMNVGGPIPVDLYDDLTGWDAIQSYYVTVPGRNSSTRLTGICTGRNLIIDHALRNGYDWIYFADSDIEAPGYTIPELLALNWKVCGAHVPSYCLHGPRVRRAPYRPGEEHPEDFPEDWVVREHWNTAGSLLVHRDVFSRVPWRHDIERGLSDDPATQAEMLRIGYPTLVRHDVICQHHPEHVIPFEERGLTV